MNDVDAPRTEPADFCGLSDRAKNRISLANFGKPFTSLSKCEVDIFRIVTEIICSQLDESDANVSTRHIEGSGMGSESDRDRYKKVLDDVRLKKRDLISRFQESYKELEAIERFAAERAGEVMSGDGFKADGFFRAQAEIGTATDPQATEWALKEIGNPATVPEIVDVLLAHGFGTDRSRDRLSNAVLIAMKRNAPFKKISRGLWALAEWDRKR